MTPNNLSSSWRYWTLRQWSAAFFSHFFEYNDEDTPVTRLVITDATWTAVTGDISASSEEMQQTFLRQFPRKRRDLNRHLSSQVLWRELSLHDFFPYLILTCLVAASSEEDAEAGQFPIRLYELLGIWGDSPLPFDGLGDVWEKLAALLKAGRNQRHPWRELVLPNPGHETRIGYSKRLAFPLRNDQQQLAPLLNTLDRSQWLDEPPIYPVLSIVERHLWKFSTAFREEFRDFKGLVSSGQETAEHPFWTAVRGVLRATRKGTRTNASRQTLDLLLLIEFDEFDEPALSLLSKTPSPWSSIASQPLDFAIAGYDRLLVVDEDSGEPARRLLSGGLLRLDVRSSLLEVVQDGLLIFQREDGYRIARTRPPESGPATVLVRQDLKNAFVSAIDPLVANRLLKPYPNTRWYWLDGLEGQQIPPLSNVRCLAQIARSASISVYDGIRCKEGGYLSRFAALPEFRLEGGQRLRLNRLSTAPASAKTPNLDQNKTGWRLRDSPETRAGIEGEFEVVAENRGGMRISARRIRFQRDVLTWDYGSPSDPTAWEIEAGQQDTASLAANDRSLWDIGTAWNPEQCLEITASLPVNEPEPGWRYTGLGDLIEALAAIGTTRTLGLAEMEFLDLLRQFLHIENDYRLIWDIARAWTEAGLLQRVSDRRWRSVRYLPQIPRLCVSRTVDGAWCGVILGLMPTSPSHWLANTANGWQMQVKSRWVASVSPWLPPGLVLTAATAEALTSFARNQSLEVVVARSLVDSLVPLDQALRHDDPPGNYSLYAAWDWEQGRFQKFTDANPLMDNSPGVFWHRRERGDRRDYFVARAENGRTLWSYSRVWSLLAGARLLGREIYRHQPDEGLVRQAAGGIHLPMVVGRLTFALSGCASGPIKNADGNINYRYPLFDDVQIEWVGTQLLGWMRRNQEQAWIPEWLRALARISNESSLLLSTDCGLVPISIPVSLAPIYRHFRSVAHK